MNEELNSRLLDAAKDGDLQVVKDAVAQGADAHVRNDWAVRVEGGLFARNESPRQLILHPINEVDSSSTKQP